MPLTTHTYTQTAKPVRGALSGAGRVVALAALLMLGNAWAGEFTDRVDRVFSSSIVGAVKESGTGGEITFKAPSVEPRYFEAGDKLGKVFAIDSARLFRDVKGLEQLTFKIPAYGKTYSMSISRADIETHYGVNFAAMNGDLDAWRTQFVQIFDNKQSRAKFSERFVTIK